MIFANRFTPIVLAIMSTLVLLCQYIRRFGNFRIPMHRTIPKAFLIPSIVISSISLLLLFIDRDVTYKWVCSRIMSNSSLVTNKLKNSIGEPLFERTATKSGLIFSFLSTIFWCLLNNPGLLFFQEPLKFILATRLRFIGHLFFITFCDKYKKKYTQFQG